MHIESLENLSPASLEPGLLEVVSDVMEQFAFMFAEPLEGNGVEFFSQHLLQAQIVFKGSVSGGLSMFATLSFCVQLATNVLGMEPEELSHDHAYDALKELVNVICGDFLLHVAGKKQVFDLSVPKIRRLPVEKAQNLISQAGVVPVLIDDHPVLLQVEIDSPL